MGAVVRSGQHVDDGSGRSAGRLLRLYRSRRDPPAPAVADGFGRRRRVVRLVEPYLELQALGRTRRRSERHRAQHRTGARSDGRHARRGSSRSAGDHHAGPEQRPPGDDGSAERRAELDLPIHGAQSPLQRIVVRIRRKTVDRHSGYGSHGRQGGQDRNGLPRSVFQADARMDGRTDRRPAPTKSSGRQLALYDPLDVVAKPTDRTR